MSYQTWNKGAPLFNLSTHFTSKEMECQCSYHDCLIQTISQDILDKIERVRVSYGMPIAVTSGYRCKKHQADLTSQGYQTATNSQHCLGNAVDVRGPLLKNLELELAKEFMALGIARSFIHADLRADKVRRWYYNGAHP